MALEWRTSSFVFLNGNRAYSDLTGRSRRVNPLEATILHYGGKVPFTVERLVSICHTDPAIVATTVEVLLKQGWIVPESTDESQVFRIDWADIETCRQCNARCGFCPQSTNPKPSGVMKSEVFSRIATTIVPYQPKSVALNHYGEPLLDPLFRERCAILKDHLLPLMLFTNGTLFTEDTCNYLLTNCMLRAIVFNYPSITPSVWAEFMRLPERFHQRVTLAIRKFADECLEPIEIFVNGITECQERRTMEIRNAFAAYPNIRVKRIVSDDRAGSQPKLVAITTTSQTERLSGCDRILRYIHFRYDGAVYLCCQDYEQTNLLGNIMQQTPGEIMAGAAAIQLRKQIYGMTSASNTLLCRGCSHLRRSPAEA